MPNVANASCPVDVHTNVAFLHQPRLSGMQTHSNPHFNIVWPVVLGQSSLNIDHGCCSIGSPGERSKESVPLGIDLPPVVLVKGCPDDGPLVGQELAVPLAQLGKKLRAALYIRKKKGDRACGQNAGQVIGCRVHVASTLDRATALQCRALLATPGFRYQHYNTS